MLTRRGWLIAAMLLPLAGCATDQPPRAELAQAEQAVDQAAAADAARYAPLPLQEARQKLESARRAAFMRDFERAGYLAREAEVSAELAVASAQTARTQALAEEALAGVQTLRQELERKEATQ